MKIALIGPGIMKIPPDKWGAVEMMIWDYAIILKDLGHRVQIINTPDKDTIKFCLLYTSDAADEEDSVDEQHQTYHTLPQI